MTTISSWNWSVEQDIAFFKSEGIAAMGVPTTKITGRRDEEVAAIAASGLTVTSVSAGADNGLLETEQGALATLKPSIDLTRSMGASSLYFLTGATPLRMATDEAFAALARCISAALAYAKEQGVRLSIENNSVSSREIGFVHTVAGAARLCRETGLGICLELQNCWYEDDLPRLFRDNMDLITMVQVSDFLIGDPLKFHRRVPGDGSMPLEWLMGQLLDAGYDGIFEIEVLGPAIEEEGYESAIRRSVGWLDERLTRWGV
ncbi:MAG: sugar phosphate isomerase/epimerase [Novosphingobium sp.]|nr:sugar phosphate isomerase/epimerase [Novosphingobium sp.]